MWRALFWLAGFLEFETELVKSNVRIAAELRYLVEAAMPDSSAGRAPSLRCISWHSPKT
jgi:hypothetical protein